MTVVGTDNFTRANASTLGTASDGHAWSAFLGSLGNTTITSNVGIVNGSVGGPQVMTLNSASTQADSEVLARFLYGFSPGHRLHVFFRLSSASINNCLYVRFNGSIQVAYYNGSTPTTIANTSAPMTDGTWYWTRTRVQGTTVYVRYWADGTSEPGTWNVTQSFSTQSATINATGKTGFGELGNGINAELNSYSYDDLVVPTVACATTSIAKTYIRAAMRTASVEKNKVASKIYTKGIAKDAVRVGITTKAVEKDVVRAKMSLPLVEKDKTLASLKTQAIEKNVTRAKLRASAVETSKVRSKGSTPVLAPSQVRSKLSTPAIEKSSVRARLKSVTVEKFRMSFHMTTPAIEKSLTSIKLATTTVEKFKTSSQVVLHPTVTAQWAVQMAFFSLLTNTTAVTNIVGDRIFDSAPKDGIFPYIQIGFASETPFNVFGKKGKNIIATIDIYSRHKGNIEIQQLKNLVDNLIDEKPLTLVGHTHTGTIATLSRTTTEYDAPYEIRHQICQFRVYTQENS